MNIPGIISKVTSLLGQSSSKESTSTPTPLARVEDKYAKYRNLSEESLRSMSREDMRNLQQMLIDNGALSATTSAGKTNADGILGSRTLAAYNKWNGSTPTQGSTQPIDRSLYKNEADYWKDRGIDGIQKGSEEAISLQNFLIKNGYLDEMNAKGKSNADGIIGSGTRAAFDKYIDNYNFYGKGVKSGANNATILTDEDAAKNERFRNADKPGVHAVSEFVGRHVSPVVGSALKWVAGDNKGIDENMFSEQDLFNMARMAAEDARNNRPMGVYGNKEYSDYKLLGAEENENPEPENQSFWDGAKALYNKVRSNEASRISRSLGSWAGNFDENGNLVINDSYDFNARGDVNGADDQSKKYGSTYDKIRQKMGTMNRNSVPVNIVIPKEMYEYALANPDATSYVAKGQWGLKMKEKYQSTVDSMPKLSTSIFNNRNKRQYSQLEGTNTRQFRNAAGKEYKDDLTQFLIANGYLSEEDAKRGITSEKGNAAFQAWKQDYNNSFGKKAGDAVQAVVGQMANNVISPVRNLRRIINQGTQLVGGNGAAMPAVTSIIEHIGGLGQGPAINNNDFSNDQINEVARAIYNAQNDKKMKGQNSSSAGSFGYQHYNSGKRLNPSDLVGANSAEANAQFTLGRANYKLSDDGTHYIVSDTYDFGNTGDYSDRVDSTDRSEKLLSGLENSVAWLTGGKGRKVNLTIPVEAVNAFRVK